MCVVDADAPLTPVPYVGEMVDAIVGAAMGELHVGSRVRNDDNVYGTIRSIDEGHGQVEVQWDSADEHHNTSYLSPKYVTVLGAAKAPKDPFPLTTKLLQRFGAGMGEPRFVRVDTRASYAAYRAEQTPELAEFHEAVVDLHERAADGEDVSEDEVERVDVLGAEAKAAEADKGVDLWVPAWINRHVRAWRTTDGEFVCASITVPGWDGEVRICTSMTPIKRWIEEMSRHAQEAQVRGAVILGVLPALGVCLGAGTVIKETAAAVPEIVRLPQYRNKEPFVVRIEPKANPAIAALIALADAAMRGVVEAQDEWRRLGDAARKGAGPVGQAMGEALTLLKNGGVRKAA